MGEGKASGKTRPKQLDAAAIVALAEHLGVATEDIADWLRQPKGIPAEVLRSWIDAWDRSRRQGGS